MRVAQRMISRNYMVQLNTSLSNRTQSLERAASGVKFEQLSDNVSDGSRAMHLHEERYQSTQQLENVENLLKEMNAVDSNMESVHSVLQTISERMLYAMSEDHGEDARRVISQEIGDMKDEIVQFMNSQFSGKYLFSGTNNSKQPFTVDETTEKLMFNGIQVDQIFQDPVDGKYYYNVQQTDPVTGEPVFDADGNPVYVQQTDPNTGGPAVDADGNPVYERKQVPHSEELYADVGLGLKINTSDKLADSRTAFQVSFNGLELMGFGGPKEQVYGSEVPSNLYDLLTEVEKALDPGISKYDIRDLHFELVELTDKVGMERTDLGSRMNFLQRAKTRLESDIDNMTELEDALVTADPANEAIKMKEHEYVWMAVLQLGSQILPTSLLDFMQ